MLKPAASSVVSPLRRLASPSFSGFGRALGASVLVLGLSGCAFSPGMYVGKTTSERTVRPWMLPAAGKEAAPAGTLIPITPELVRQQRAARVADIPAEVKALFGTPQPYTIGPGDVLNIFVWDHPELNITAAGGLGSDRASLAGVGNGYNVSADGRIQFPYVGTLNVAGLNEYEARDLITQRLSRFIKDPQITLRIQAYRSGRIYVDGEVREPGIQALNDLPPTLPDILARAGGFTSNADRSAIALTRDGKTTTINLPLLTEKGVNPSGILLRSGDLVRVFGREESKVFVLGEVSRLGTQTLRNGRLTLNEALGDAGGVNPGSADPRQVFIIRAANTEKPEIYHLDARSPFAFALAEGFELRARDVVYVDPVPLVRWNRVISLILPSAQAVTTTRTSVDAVK